MSALFDATALVVPFENLRMTDVEAVGGKNASLGEMISQLPRACACPPASRPRRMPSAQFLEARRPGRRISKRLADARHRRRARAGRRRRRDPRLVEAQPFPADLEAIRAAFETLSAGNPTASFAVRSSATAEDLPDASFAGQQETFLNVVGIETCCTR
jgi:pyruvate,water dikinase